MILQLESQSAPFAANAGYQDAAVIKNAPMFREGMKLQRRAEFYDLFNHPNLYVNSGSN